jgi:quinol monooxygenase YgiN
MVTEVARFFAAPGQGDAFENAVKEGLRVIQRQSAHQRSSLMRGVEHPEEFTLLVVWESLEAKMAFRNGPEFPEWRKHINDLMARPPESAHWTVLLDTASDVIGASR